MRRSLCCQKRRRSSASFGVRGCGGSDPVGHVQPQLLNPQTKSIKMKSTKKTRRDDFFLFREFLSRFNFFLLRLEFGFEIRIAFESQVHNLKSEFQSEEGKYESGQKSMEQKTSSERLPLGFSSSPVFTHQLNTPHWAIRLVQYPPLPHSPALPKKNKGNLRERKYKTEE